LLLSLAPSDRHAVAHNLQLPNDSIERLSHLEIYRTEIESELSEYKSIGQIVKLLQTYDLPALILVALQGNRAIRQTIWKYLTIWKQVRSPLNGNDLKALGYPSGALYREILEDLLAATLDGTVSDRSSALVYLAQKYSL
jgi:tRNA nucleotidyltransferase (CCA-adding enzyme)